MLNTYKVLTVTYKSSNVNKIGDFVLKYDEPSQLQHALQALKERFQCEELFYLSTCNRVLYLFKTTDVLSPTFQYHFFRHINPDIKAETIRESVLAYEGETALSHLCAVASSVDSMVIGEREILRQLRTAYNQCYQWGLTGDDIRIAMELAVRTAKDVYSNTKIGEKPVSIASLAALQLRNSTLPKNARILVIGAGQTNMLIGKFLLKYHYTNVKIFNRTLDKATKLAKQLDGAAYRLKDLATYEKGFDAIIICTGATKPILTPELYAQLLQGDQQQKLVIDIAIPNNTDKSILKTHDVKYIEVETLRHVAKENLAFRQTEVHRAKKIVGAHLTEFPQIYQSRQLEKAMKTVPDAIKAVKSNALNNVFKSEVEALDDNSRELLERVMSYMEKKCIGIPMQAARRAMQE
ncbi:MAG: glutamyl-tRNA reductase [Bacteroidota bacterium]